MTKSHFADSTKHFVVGALSKMFNVFLTIISKTNKIQISQMQE